MTERHPAPGLIWQYGIPRLTDTAVKSYVYSLTDSLEQVRHTAQGQKPFGDLTRMALLDCGKVRCALDLQGSYWSIFDPMMAIASW